MRTNFASRLRTLRESSGLSVAELAERAGIHRVHLHQIERGDRTPNWQTVERLAKALGVSTEKFRAATE